MRIRNFFLAAFFALAITVFFACSSGLDGNGPGGPGETGNLSVNFQIYLDSYKYPGDGVIRMELWNNERRSYEYIDIGTVKNGIGTFNLSGNLSDKYLGELQGMFESSVSAIPRDAKATLTFFYVISGNEAFWLEARNESETGYEYLDYYYVSQIATVTGNENYNGTEFQYDINAHRGWNVVYNNCTGYFCKVSTNSNTVSLSQIKWVMEYKGSCSSYGGCDERPSSSSNPSSSSKPSSSSFGGNPSGTWCVDHDSRDCSNHPDHLSSPQACADEWFGILLDYCPSGYEVFDYNYDLGPYCVFEEECLPIWYLEEYGYTCSMVLGEIVDYCP